MFRDTRHRNISDGDLAIRNGGDKMAIRGISYSEQHWYVSRHDPDADPALTEDENIEKGATIFYWGAIPSNIMARISDQQQTATVEVGEMMKQTFNQKTGARNREAFKWGVREPGWRNFADKDGPIIPRWDQILEGGATYKVLSDDTLNRVPLAIMQEVGTEIFNGNSMTDVQRKNLEEALSHLDAMPDGSALNAAVKNALNGDAKPRRSRKATSRSRTKKPTSTGTTL